MNIGGGGGRCAHGHRYASSCPECVPVTPEQPMPKGSGEPVFPVLRNEVRKLIDQREAKGLATYGESLRTHNGRDFARDAIEEWADLGAYLVGLRIERDSLVAELAQTKEETSEIVRAGMNLADKLDVHRREMARNVTDIVGNVCCGFAFDTGRANPTAGQVYCDFCDVIGPKVVSREQQAAWARSHMMTCANHPIAAERERCAAIVDATQEEFARMQLFQCVTACATAARSIRAGEAGK